MIQAASELDNVSIHWLNKTSIHPRMSTNIVKTKTLEPEPTGCSTPNTYSKAIIASNVHITFQS